MLLELRVRDLGVIEELTLVLGAGLTAVTGETGAGKTLVVDAIDLLMGGRADPALVRPGASEAWVEGRFVDEAGAEVILARAVPADGRSRAYLDGHLATAAALSERGRDLVDLHGQHGHQSLLSTAVQRGALDLYAGVDLAPLRAARARIAEIDATLAALGGDERARAREIDLLRFQVAELEAAAIAGPDEDADLDAEEDVLADAVAHREAGAIAAEALSGDGGATDALGRAISALAARGPFAALDDRLRGLAAEVTDVAVEARGVAEGISDDPARLDEVRARRALLADLRRKYGDTLAEVLSHAAESAARLAELEHHDERAAALDAERTEALRVAADAAAEVGVARRAAAPGLAAAVETHLRDLAMPRARVEVSVGDDDPGDDVAILLAANPGGPALPLAKAASGGELARAMLALRLVLTSGPPTLVFDEVDAGIGGEAAVAVGRSLATLAPDRQVLVVTHLPQVAAFADGHVAVEKLVEGDRTRATATLLDGAGRVVELSRMLSGQPDSRTARDHAEELLALAAERDGEGA